MLCDELRWLLKYVGVDPSRKQCKTTERAFHEHSKHAYKALQDNSKRHLGLNARTVACARDRGEIQMHTERRQANPQEPARQNGALGPGPSKEPQNTIDLDLGLDFDGSTQNQDC